MTTDEDRLHVERLAGELGARLIYDADRRHRDNGPRADPSTGEIHLIPWEEGEPGSYWTALHELGHVATTTPSDSWAQMFGFGEVVVTTEARAWDWALDNAYRSLDDDGRARLAFSLSSYFDAYSQFPREPVVKRVVTAVGNAPDLRQLGEPVDLVWRSMTTWGRAVDVYGLTPSYALTS